MKKIRTMLLMISAMLVVLSVCISAEVETLASSIPEPQDVTVEWGENYDWISRLRVYWKTPKEVIKMYEKDDSLYCFAQLDWRLVGKDIKDDWKYDKAWDSCTRKTEDNYAEYIDMYTSMELGELSDADIIDFYSAYSEYKQYTEWKDIFSKYIPKTALNTITVDGNKQVGIDYENFAVEVRLRIGIRKYNENTGEHEYEFSDWSKTASYGNFSKDYSKIDNLLVNPDFEQGLTGWKNPDKKWGIVNKIDSNYVATHGRFLAWSVRSCELEKNDTYIYQDVSLKGHGTDETVIFNTMLCNYDQPPHDAGIIQLEFLDKNGKVLKTYKQSQRNPNWNSQTIVASIAEKAVTARVYLIAHRYVGVDIDAYYDYCSFVIKKGKGNPVIITEAKNKSKVKAGDKLTLTANNGKTKAASKYIWTSSHDLDATVNSKGVVTIHTDCEDGIAIYAKDKDTGVVGVYWINSTEKNEGSVDSKEVPSKPTISSVTAGSKAFTLKWKKVSNITGYQIRYSTSSSMSSAKTVTISSAATLSKKITNLKASKKYYIQIRAFKTVNGKKVYSNWSTKTSVTTKK